MDNQYLLESYFTEFLEDVVAKYDRNDNYFRRRSAELIRLIEELPTKHNISDAIERLDDITDELHDLDHSSQAYRISSIVKKLKEYSK